MNLNGKLRKKLGGPSKNLGGPWPTQAPFRIATGRGPRAALSGGRHFDDQKLIFERSLKVLVFRYYFKYIFYRLSTFMFRSSKLVG